MPRDFSEDDLALTHALQIHPRARWADLAPVLGSAPATLARRWAALRAVGLAWVTAYRSPVEPARTVTGLVELDCLPGRLDEVVVRLETEPGVITIEHAASGPDLMLTVAASTFADMSALVMDTLARTPGARSMRTHIAAQVHVEGSRWRLDALTAGQRDAVLAAAARDHSPGPAVDTASPTFAPLVRVLAHDGRANAAEVAVLVGRPQATVRRQLGALLRSGSVAFRCDVAQMLTRWPVNVTWWCRIPGADVERVVRHVRSDARVRLCMSLTGPANFLVTAWTASLHDLMQMQAWLEGALPVGGIVDVTVVLRTRKRMGWLLHPDGRCTGDVVAATWESQSIG